MIPTIEEIVEELSAGNITKSQAVTWLHQHAQGAVDELRDYFAAKAMGAYVNSELLMSSNTEEECVLQFINVAAFSYRLADAMLAERDK